MKIDKEKLIKMKTEGATTSRCAKYFDCTDQAIRDAVRKLKEEGLLPFEHTADASDYIQEKHLQTDPIENENERSVAEWLEAEEAESKLKEASAASDPTGIYADIVYTTESDKNPINLAPPIDRKTFWAMRRDELRGAICEYACCGLHINPEWVEEYNDLIEEE
jgi:hypothetical protein